MADKLAITARIKQARVEAGYTQEEMADLLHVRPRTYQAYEAQSERLSVVPYRLLDEICAITGKTTEWLLHGDGAPATAPDMAERLTRLEAMLEEIAKAVGATAPPSHLEAEAETAADEVSGTPRPARQRNGRRRAAG